MTIFKVTEFPQDDFSLYFKGTLLKLMPPENVGAKPEWVWYDGYTEKIGHQFRRTNASHVVFHVDKTAIKKYCIEVKFPYGFFNTKTSVVFCERIGARQNYKGLNVGGNFSMQPMEAILSSSIPSSAAPTKLFTGLDVSARDSKWGPELANFIFEVQQYLPLPEAAAQIRSRKALARALSPHFALTPHHENKDFLVFFHEFPVAALVSKTNKVKVLLQDFRQELIDFLEPQGATVLNT